MPWCKSTGLTKIERNHVYVIPPGRELTMVDGALDVAETQRPRGPHTVIDVFFRTLAHQHRTRAVGIVLSGTGSDGAVGIASLKERAAVAIAQAPEDAEHDACRRARSPPARSTSCCRSPLFRAPESGSGANASRIEILDSSAGDPKAGPARRAGAEEALRDVMKVLHQRTGHDFKHYKRATGAEAHRAADAGQAVPTLGAYRSFLGEDAAEPQALLGDMLIGVTQFFRDPGAFDALQREAMPEIFRQAARTAARCAAGSPAAPPARRLLDRDADADEAAGNIPPATFTLFATRHRRRGARPRCAGVYPAAIVADLPPARLKAGSRRAQRLLGS
jgi:two-component system CheB/CheR fusion protein